MTSTITSPAGVQGKPANRYRLPGIEREGIAQLSLLETALWPLQGGKLEQGTFATDYGYTTPAGRKTATVTVRAPCGFQAYDELVLWGLLGATLGRQDGEPVLLATPYWMLKHLGFETGGFQYAQLKESLLRLALTSYQNTAFYNPQSGEREFAAFQFLSILLPTVGGVGETVDTERCWRIEWNAPFFRFCKATGGNLLFDIDLYRKLSPASRRLFLKLKDRFWRSKRVFLNVDDLTINGLGFAAHRPLRKRKFDLTTCIRELLEYQIIELGRGQTDPKELFQKRGKGSYVVVFYEGEYFRRPQAERTVRQKKAILDDPLYRPLRTIGVDGPGIARLLKDYSRGIIQRWVRITDAALHEQPRGFGGFRASPAAFLIDGIQHGRMPPDWMYAHDKRQERAQWDRERAASPADDADLRAQYERERSASVQAYLKTADGQRQYDNAYQPLLAFHRVTDPHSCHTAAHAAALDRIARMHCPFPAYGTWVLSQQREATTHTA